MTPRDAICRAATVELGPDSHEKRVRYWTSALGRPVTYQEIASLAWCGGFALFCLHEAGVALDVHWRIGAGFLLQPPRPLKPTKSPLPGDIGYQHAPFQHHFVVEQVDGSLVHSIDGNQPGVTRRTRSFGPALTFYSIAPLLTAELPSVAPPPIKKHPTVADVQRAVNGLILRHLDDAPPALLKVDGIIGPKSTAALQWAQRTLGIPVTGNPDSATCHSLGLS